MTRTDRTTGAYQATYRGRHLPAGGRSGQGKRYLYCACGWQLSGISAAERARAQALYQAHISGEGK